MRQDDECVRLMSLNRFQRSKQKLGELRALHRRIVDKLDAGWVKAVKALRTGPDKVRKLYQRYRDGGAEAC